MSHRKPLVFTLERLEGREVPATFGIPWADSRVSVSFVPDGTNVDGKPSALTSVFQSAGLTADQGQREILKAVQTWVQQAGLDVRTVTDSGADSGSVGLTQGDPRFGDIRVSARPLSTGVLAITTPSGVPGDTRTGDIIFNSNVVFSRGGTGGPDLFTVALQEAGHGFGLANSTDQTSPMYEQYRGPRTGVTSGDATRLQELYGPREADRGDRYEGGGNDILSKASNLGNGGSTFVVDANLNQAQDVDFYKFKTPNQADSDGFAVWLQSKGKSLVAARLSVLTTSGMVIASMAADNPNTTDLTVQVLTATPNTTYYLKVEGNSGTDFRVGNYMAKVVFDPNAPVVEATTGLTVLDDDGTNEVIDKATELKAPPSTTSTTVIQQLQYMAAAKLRTAGDMDFYRLKSSKVGKNEVNLVTITVHGTDGVALAPRVLAFDDKKVLLTAQVLASDSTSVTLQIENVKSDKTFYISVAGAAAGQYLLEVNFRTQVVNKTTYASGTLTAAAPTAVRKMQVAQSQLLNFTLGADSANTTGQTGVRMTIYDSANRAVYSLFARAGKPVSGTALLGAGNYTVVATAGTSDNRPLSNTTFTLQGALLSDPIGTGSTGSDGTTDVQPIVATPTAGDITQILTVLPVVNPWL